MGDTDSRFADADVAVEADDNGTGPASVLEALKERRRDATLQRFLDIDVPGYRGLLVMRCGPLPGKMQTRIRERYDRSRSPDRDFNLNADTLIAACHSVLGRRTLRDPLQELDPDDPVRIEERLAQMLDLPAGSARDVLRGVFGMANSPDLAITAEAGRYIEWASSATDEVDEELLGES